MPRHRACAAEGRDISATSSVGTTLTPCAERRSKPATWIVTAPIAPGTARQAYSDSAALRSAPAGPAADHRSRIAPQHPQVARSASPGDVAANPSATKRWSMPRSANTFGGIFSGFGLTPTDRLRRAFHPAHQIAVEHIRERELWFKVDDYGRIHTNLTNLSKMLAPHT